MLTTQPPNDSPKTQGRPLTTIRPIPRNDDPPTKAPSIGLRKKFNPENNSPPVIKRLEGKLLKGSTNDFNLKCVVSESGDSEEDSTSDGEDSDPPNVRSENVDSIPKKDGKGNLLTLERPSS